MLATCHPGESLYLSARGLTDHHQDPITTLATVQILVYSPAAVEVGGGAASQEPGSSTWGLMVEMPMTPGQYRVVYTATYQGAIRTKEGWIRVQSL